MTRKLLFALLFLPFLLVGQNTFIVDFETTPSFIENKGQFDGRNWSKDDIKFGFEKNKLAIFFTNKGLTYRFDKIIRNPKRKIKGDAHDPSISKRTNISELIHVNFINSNSNVKIIPEYENEDYFSYAFKDYENNTTKNINHLKGFKKLTYKNIYNKIDLIYEFHPKGGLKYSLILHSGANPNDIKIKYTTAHTKIGSENIELKLNKNGQFEVITSLGRLFEHNPLTFYAEDENEISSKFKFEENILSFDLDNYDNTKEVIIDPWVVASNFSTSTAVREVETDASGNVYAIGGEVPMELKKYNSSGALQWTYTTPWDTTGGGWLGTLATDDSGESYITQGTSPEMERVNSAGSMSWHKNGGGLDEYWSISFNCDKTKLIVGGTRLGNILAGDTDAMIFEIETSTGNILNELSVHNGMSGGFIGTPIEVRSITSSKNAKYAFLTHTEVGIINQNFGSCPDDLPTFNVDNQHHLGYKCENFLGVEQNGGGLKAIIANEFFFYTHVGDQILKWDLFSGVLLATVALPGGSSATSLGDLIVHNTGLAVDDNGNVYAGSDDRVVKFDSDLNILQQVNTNSNFTVYDVSVSNNGEIIACGAIQDDQSVNRNGKIEAIDMNAGAQFALICCDVNICPVDPVCDTDAPFNIDVSVIGGVFSGPGIIDANAGTFDPSVAGVGTHTITYTKPCGSETVEIMVSPCDPLEICVETNGDFTVSNGIDVYVWEEWLPASTTPITNEAECVACGYTWDDSFEPFIAASCKDGLVDVSDCNTTAGYSNFATGSTATPSGNYPIQVTDGYGTVYVINDATAAAALPACSPCTDPTLSETHVDLTCAGDNSGSIDLTITPGSGTTYSSSWSGPSSFSSTNEDVTGLAAGTYNVTVSDDASSCSATISVIVADGVPTDDASFTLTDFCEGTANSATITGTTGGTFTFNPVPTSGETINGTTGSITDGLGGNSYTIEYTTNGTCPATSTQNVTINANPIPTISGSLTFCTGNTTTLDAGIYSSWAWVPNGEVTQTVNVGVAGNYTVSVTDANGCVGTNMVAVSESSSLSPSITGVLTICSGAATILDAGAGYAGYLWDDSGTSITQTISVTTGGSYSVTVSDASGCTGIDQVTVTENNNPTPAITGSLSYCAGGYTTLDAGSGYADYAWNPTGTMQTINANTAGTYIVTVTDGNGCTGTDQVDVILAAGLSPTITGVLTICSGNATTLDAGTGYAAYLWDDVSSSITQTISVTTGGTYSVTVSDASGCTGIDQVTVSENNNPTPSITGALSFCTGGSTTLDAGAGYATYTWTPFGTSQTMNATSGGTYSVTVSDNNGCMGSDQVTVVVASSLSPNITGNLSYCEGGSTTLDAGSGYAIYSWSPSGATQTITANAGQYEVTVSDASGCTGTDQVTVVENANPIPNISGNLAYCSGSSTTLDAGSGYTSYTWLPSGNSQTISVNTTNVYSVTVIDVNGCSGNASVNVTENPIITPNITGNTSICAGNNANLDAGSGYSYYVWSNSATTQTVNVSSEGIYNVTVTDGNGCTGTDAINVDVNEITINTTGNQTICFGTSADITANVFLGGNPPYIYTWSTGETGTSITVTPTGQQLISVFVTDNMGCSSQMEYVTINVTDPVEYQLFANKDSVCPGDPVLLSGSISNGTPPYTVVNQSGSIVSNTETVYINEQTTYIYTVTDACGSTATGQVNVAVYPVPNLSFSADVLSGCQPLIVNFIETSASNNGYAYTWFFGDNNDNNLSFNQNTTHIFESNGIFDVGVSVMTDDGCKNSLVINNLIEVYKRPDAMFEATPDYVTIIDPVISFNNHSEWANSFMWSFGDGDSSNIVSPSHSYMNIQDYMVQLIAISDKGCKDTVYHKIIVDDIFTMYVPTAFSPDNDGINDEFIVKAHGVDLDGFNMKIYDRWGEVIFDTNDMYHGWNGKYPKRDDFVQNNTYVWLVKFKTFTGIEYTRSGTVTVIR